MLVVMLSIAGGCIFSMNDDYSKAFTVDGGLDGGEYTVSGFIIDSSGEGISGVEIDFVGTLTESATTDEDGAYEFEKVAGGSYVVTPPGNEYAQMPITLAGEDYFVGTVRSGGHGANKNVDYSCS